MLNNMLRKSLLGPEPLAIRLGISQRSKSYSAQERHHPSVTVYMEKTGKRQNNIFAPSKDFPFCGQVGTAQIYLGELNNTQVPKPNVKVTRWRQSKSVEPLTAHKLVELLDRRINRNKAYSPEQQLKDYSFCFDDEVITIHACECPRLLRKELKVVFKSTKELGKLLKDQTLSVVNIFQQERQTFEEITAEQKMDAKITYFVETADLICELLNKRGFWADYLDPISGRPRRAPASAADRLLRPDEARQAVGFHLEELKNCVRIGQVHFANREYVGSIFTNAPLDQVDVLGLLDLLHNAEVVLEPYED